jgi:hypothetical protein
MWGDSEIAVWNILYEVWDAQWTFKLRYQVGRWIYRCEVQKR